MSFALALRVEMLNWYFGFSCFSAVERSLSCVRPRAHARIKPLALVSVGVKDLLLLKSASAEASSLVLNSFVSGFDAEAVWRSKRAGATVLYKANMDEFGVGYASLACGQGRIASAWAPTLVQSLKTVALAGGSSGGCASAVALGCSTVALGTDTGGSVRQPASYNGIVGLKPTYGRCSRWGVIAYSSSLDQVGVLARASSDCALLCSAVFGVDSKDWTSAKVPVPKYELYVDSGFGLARASGAVLVLRRHAPCSDQSWTYSLACLARAGFELVEIDLPFVDMVLPCYCVLSSVECCSNLARYDGIKFGLKFKEANSFALYSKLRSVGFSVEVKRKLLTGAYVMATRLGYERYYLKAQRLRFGIKNCLTTRLRHALAVATPLVSSSWLAGGFDRCANTSSGVYTVLANLTGLPSVSTPSCTNCAGVPFGLQLVAKPFDELSLISISRFVSCVSGKLAPIC
ncbi:amidase family protein [Candidatus Hodgkinia cicadicola]